MSAPHQPLCSMQPLALGSSAHAWTTILFLACSSASAVGVHRAPALLVEYVVLGLSAFAPVTEPAPVVVFTSAALRGLSNSCGSEPSL